MVRLVITDFSTQEENEFFYPADEYEAQKYFLTYHRFKKYGLFLSKSYEDDDVYSLSLLSKHYLKSGEFLVYISDYEFVILFNHKRVYSSKINPNFIIDDIIKSVLIAKHIIMLTNTTGNMSKLYCVANTKYRYAVENIVTRNITKDSPNISAEILGRAEELVKPLNELTTMNNLVLKNIAALAVVGVLWWVAFFAYDMLILKFVNKHSTKAQEIELRVQKRLIQKEKIAYKKLEKEYNTMLSCISKDGNKK